MPIEFAELPRVESGVPPGQVLGRSREGREIHGFRFGHGPTRVSLIGGCHADEPVGPDLLWRLVLALARLAPDHPAHQTYSWWIAPHVNPDGAARNAAWADPLPPEVDPVAYLRHVVRELPGDDVEFGFPRDENDHEARPENRALNDWWRAADGPFHVHGSLHGTMWAFGAWWLLEPGWADRTRPLQQRCADAAGQLGYGLHDLDRGGEKGFARISPGFTTRPDSRRMAAYFRSQGDEAMAARFRPSSFETMRDLGGDPLCFVTELALFLEAPPPGEPPYRVAAFGAGKAKWERWALQAAQTEDDAAAESELRAEIARTGVRGMPIDHQQQLQWELVRSALETVGAVWGPFPAQHWTIPLRSGTRILSPDPEAPWKP